MADTKAAVEVQINGTEAAKSKLDGLDKGFQGMGKSAVHSGKAIGAIGAAITSTGGAAVGVLKSMVGNLVGVATEGAKAAGIIRSIDLAGAVEGARRLDSAVASFGQQAGKSSAALKQNFEGLESRTLQSAEATTAYAHTLSELTGDGAFAAAAIGDIEEAALALGRDAGAMLPVAATLKAMGVEGAHAKDELNRMSAIAERVGTIGGPRAFLDVMAALRPQLQGVAMESDAARAKMEAFIAVLGKGRNKEQQTQIAAGAVNFVKQNSLMLERATGMKVYDKDGKMQDPTKILEKYRSLFEKRYGKGTVKYDRAMRNAFGDDLGMALGGMNFQEMRNQSRAAQGRAGLGGMATPGAEPLTGFAFQQTGSIDEQANKARGDVANKREGSELQRNSDMRQAGEFMLGLKDDMRETLGNRGSEIVASGIGLLPSQNLQLAAAGLVTAGISGPQNNDKETTDAVIQFIGKKNGQTPATAKDLGATSDQMDKLIKLQEQQLQVTKAKRLSTNEGGNEYNG